MASQNTKTVRRTTTTTYWTRRYVFACNHTTDRYYPVKDAVNTDHTKPKSVPLLLPVRLGRDCTACLRRVVLERAQTKAADVRSMFNTLCAKLERPKTLSGGLDEPLVLEEDDGAGDEVWPDEPPSLEALFRLFVTKAADITDSGSGSDSDTNSEITVKAKTSAPTATSPVVRHEKLSDQIRSIHKDLERRRQAWEKSSKVKTEAAVEASA